MSFLKIQNLSKTIRNTQILKSISFQADLGQVVAFLGPNGAGKTTLLKTIIGLYKTPKANIDEETNIIMLNKSIINKWPIHKKVEMGMLYLPQQTSLFQQMTVEENLQLIYEYLPYWRANKLKVFLEEQDHWLKQTNLNHATKQTTATLSGGQKRKLEVVRSLLMHPKLILLDEPFAGVDPKSIYELKKIFLDMASQSKIGILISDHHVDQLFSIATTVYVIIKGKVVTSGSIKDILANKFTKDSYLGNQFYDEMAKRFLQ